jgi:hypothetical protein
MGVLSDIDIPHAAASELFEDRVVRKSLAEHA